MPQGAGAACCAGIVRTSDFLDMSDEDFDDVIDTNLKGVFIVSLFSRPDSLPASLPAPVTCPCDAPLLLVTALVHRPFSALPCQRDRHRACLRKE